MFLNSGEKSTDLAMLRIVPFVHLAHASCSMVLRIKFYRHQVQAFEERLRAAQLGARQRSIDSRCIITS